MSDSTIYRELNFERERFGNKSYATPQERQLFYEIQEKAKPVMVANDRMLPIPENESSLSYRKRIVEKLKFNSDLAKVDVSKVPEKEFAAIEQRVYADARKNADKPLDLKPGELREHKYIDGVGRVITEFRGLSPAPWMNQYKSVGIVSPICFPNEHPKSGQVMPMGHRE